MFAFGVGWLSFAGALLFVALYLFFHVLRKTGAWLQRDDQPKERVGAYIVIWFVFGFIVGSMAQPIFDRASLCKQIGKPVFQCAILKAN
jgi:ABC-type polysaccharide/polyol phosphate export permease